MSKMHSVKFIIIGASVTWCYRRH